MPWVLLLSFLNLLEKVFLFIVSKRCGVLCVNFETEKSEIQTFPFHPLLNQIRIRLKSLNFILFFGLNLSVFSAQISPHRQEKWGSAKRSQRQQSLQRLSSRRTKPEEAGPRTCACQGGTCKPSPGSWQQGHSGAKAREGLAPTSEESVERHAFPNPAIGERGQTVSASNGTPAKGTMPREIFTTMCICSVPRSP